MDRLDEVLEVLEKERACVIRNRMGTCNFECGKCDLVEDAGKIICAYDYAINTLRDCKRKVT